MNGCFQSPVVIGLSAHFELEYTTLEELIAEQPALVPGFAVQFGRLDIAGTSAITFCFDNERLARCVFVAQLNLDSVEQRTAQLVGRMLAGTALHVKQSHRCHHKPGTQLALVFVLTVAITMLASCAIELLANQAGPLLGEIRLA